MTGNCDGNGNGNSNAWGGAGRSSDKHGDEKFGDGSGKNNDSAN